MRGYHEVGGRGANSNAFRDQRRAGSRSAAIIEPNPAILACSHEAKPGARFVVKFHPADECGIDQDSGEKRIACACGKERSVDAELNRRSFPLHSANKQTRSSVNGSSAGFRHPVPSPPHKSGVIALQ
jgi:hypothetical protein